MEKGLGYLKGKWDRWKEFIRNNPNTTPSEIFHFSEGLRADYGLQYLPYIKY
jgi:hypothetical protein